MCNAIGLWLIIRHCEKQLFCKKYELFKHFLDQKPLTKCSNIRSLFSEINGYFGLHPHNVDLTMWHQPRDPAIALISSRGYWLKGPQYANLHIRLSILETQAQNSSALNIQYIKFLKVVLYLKNLNRLEILQETPGKNSRNHSKSLFTPEPLRSDYAKNHSTTANLYTPKPVLPSVHFAVEKISDFFRFAQEIHTIFSLSPNICYSPTVISLCSSKRIRYVSKKCRWEKILKLKPKI